MRVDKASRLPRYAQARNFLEDLIREGGLGPGDQIPSERELATRFEVSQMTMNRAIQDLVREGILYREVGRGTFVVHRDGDGPHHGSIALATLHSLGGLKTDPYSGEVFRGAHAAAVETQWDIVLLQELLDNPDGLYPRLKGRADGFLFLSPPDDALPALRRLRQDGARFLSVGSSWPDESIPAIDTDNRLGAALAVEHLVGLGHRRIGFIGAPENMSNSRDRHEGFRGALNEHNLIYHPEWGMLRDAAGPMSESQKEQLLANARNPNGPTAIFAAGYILAVTAIESLQSGGLRVPEDISVVGFDDKFSAAFLNPPLTTIAQPLEEMGRLAVQRLEECLGGGAGGRTIDRIPTVLIVRGSTAPPPER